MAIEYPTERLWKIYEKLPEDLKEALFSPDVAESIDDVCKRYEISEEKAKKISKFVGQVFLGLLPPNEFEETLKKELELESETAKRVSREISRYVFFPVKHSLEELYKIEITPAGIRPIPRPAPPPPKPVEKPIEKKPPVTDIYREPIE